MYLRNTASYQFSVLIAVCLDQRREINGFGNVF